MAIGPKIEIFFLLLHVSWLPDPEKPKKIIGCVQENSKISRCFDLWEP